MIKRASFTFIVGLALVAPAGAQVTGVPGGVSGGVPGGVPDGIATQPPTIAMPVAPTPPMAPMPPLTLGPVGSAGPMGLGPIGPGPMGVGPIGPGPMVFAMRGFSDGQDREAERQDREREQRDRELERARAERDRESSLYEQGNNAIYEARWDRAVNSFTRLAELKGTRADAALYWKSYAQNRLGQRADALATIAELNKGYPNSRYLKEAKALEVEVRGAAGQPVRPEAQADEDLKLMAMQGLANSDPATAVPILEKMLNGTASPRLKERALYVLAQMNTPKAREILMNIAKGRSIPELQSRAIQYLGVHGGRESRAALAEIYADHRRRRRNAASCAPSWRRAKRIACSPPRKPSRTPSSAPRPSVSWARWARTTSSGRCIRRKRHLDVKRQILSAMQAGGNATRVIEIAKTEKDPELRRLAVRNLGVMGSKAAGDALVEIYGTEKDPAIRRQVINALFYPGQRDRARRPGAQGAGHDDEDRDGAAAVEHGQQGRPRLHAGAAEVGGGHADAHSASSERAPRRHISRGDVGRRRGRGAAAAHHERTRHAAAGGLAVRPVVPLARRQPDRCGLDRIRGAGRRRASA